MSPAQFAQAQYEPNVVAKMLRQLMASFCPYNVQFSLSRDFNSIGMSTTNKPIYNLKDIIFVLLFFYYVLISYLTQQYFYLYSYFILIAFCIQERYKPTGKTRGSKLSSTF